MKNNMKNIRKGNTAILFAVMMVVCVLAVVPTATAVPDDYYMYGDWNLGASGNDYITGINGYVDTNGTTGWGDPGDEYIIFTGSFSDYGGDHTAYIYKVETAGDPNMHPDNPEANGSISNRTFTLVSSHYMGNYASGHDNAFYVDDTGIYYGASPGWGGMMGCGIYHWAFNWSPLGCVVPTSAPAGTQTLACNPNTGDWWVGLGGRQLYKWDGSSWVYQFTHPDLIGSHHDGMEIIGDSLFISDMTSDVIIQYRLDASGNVIDPPDTPYNTFNYTTPAYRNVEGMGYGPNKHIWISGWSSYTIYEIGGGKLQIALEGIPDQCVLAGESFETFDLDNYTVGNIDHYGYSGNVNLSVSIDAENVTTITYPAGWTGSETITFIAYNASNGVIDSDDATFTVDPVPIVGDIPNQTAPFETFDLDGYLLIGSASPVTWSASDPGGNWTVVIDGDNNVTVTAPDGAKAPVTITFTATATACGGDVSDCDDATFIPNQPPNVTDAYPSIDCLWPPNHKFVDITIKGVTDPDGDVVTITVTNITSDEPTASIKGAGGAKHAPDADGVGTDTASLRAERSGTGNGRVYEITFVASDGIAETEGSVTVCVPHDYRGKCVCGNIDDGQIYDATAIN
jgi:hypothetical protein